MSVIVRGFDSLSLSDSLRDALRRRLRELIGLALIVLAMLLAVALASWSVQDPSLSHATNAPVRNLLGHPGAIVADLLMQLFGIAPWCWCCQSRSGAGGCQPSPAQSRTDPPARWLAAVLLARELCRLPAAHARHGRCRPALAASSATGCCGFGLARRRDAPGPDRA